MVQAAAAPLAPWLDRLPLYSKGRNGHGSWKGRVKEAAVAMRRPKPRNLPESRRAAATSLSSSASGNVGGKQPPPPKQGLITASSTISIDIPLRETTGVSVDEFLSDRPRIVRATFPDSKSRRLNEEEWTIHLVPIQFFFVSASPVVAVRFTYKSRGEEYIPVVPGHATSALEIKATGWELRGIDSCYLPPYMAINVHGAMYPDRKGKLSSLKSHIDMSIGCILPPVFALVPHSILKDMLGAVLRSLAEKMKHDFYVGLYADFVKFQQEKLTKQGGAATKRPSTSRKLRPS